MMITKIIDKILLAISKILGYKSKDQFVENIKTIEQAIFDFEYFLNRDDYFTKREMWEWRKRYKKYRKHAKTWYGRVKQIPGLEQTAFTFNTYCEQFQTLRKTHNESYIDSSLKKHKIYFDTIRGHPLTDEQRLAIVTNEHNNYVNAGAGCGKTETIIAKIAFLTQKKKIDQHRILVLVFNDSATKVVKERLKKININSVNVKTFHSFGNHIVRQISETPPEILFTKDREKKEFIQDLFEACMCQQSSYLKKAVYYFSYYLQENKDPSDFKDINSLEEYNKSGNHRTIDGKYVRSPQELKIANFLYLNSVEYDCERQYEHDTRTKEYSQYRPDFYLRDYGIYLEHFAMNLGPNGNYVSIFEGYLDQHEWKQRLHKQHGTNMLSTFSYQFKDGTIFEHLLTILTENGVKLRTRPYNEVLRILRENNDKVIYKFTDLMMTFMSLLKSSGKSLSELAAKNKKNSRNMAFIELFRPIYDIYQSKLNSEGGIDFDDMISDSTRGLQKKEYTTEYDYIIVDEFQDIGYGRFRLVDEIRRQNKEAKIFCVGDDWQSIYRFTGGDVSILYNFNDYFGNYTKKLKLTKTFRLSKEVATMSNKFIRMNPNQTKKTIKTDKEKPGSIVFAVKQNDQDLSTYISIVKGVDRLAKENNETVSVLVLNRYKFLSVKQKYEKLELSCADYRNTILKFSTVHNMKGGEAEYVIVDDVNEGFTGFPNKMGDDSVLKMLLRSQEDFMDAEERRLFYVALTRCKRQVFILSLIGKSSSFFNETQNTIFERLFCTSCGGYMVKRTNQEKETEFFGCKNFPICKHTIEPDDENQKYLNIDDHQRKLNVSQLVIR